MSIPKAPRVLIEDLPALEALTPEEAAELFGAGPRPTARLGLERLEAAK